MRFENDLCNHSQYQLVQDNEREKLTQIVYFYVQTILLQQGILRIFISDESSVLVFTIFFYRKPPEKFETYTRIVEN